MVVVEPQQWKQVWNGFLPQSHLESNAGIREQSHASASFYINHWLHPSWTDVYAQLYKCNQKNALEKVIQFIRPEKPPGNYDMQYD